MKFPSIIISLLLGAILIISIAGFRRLQQQGYIVQHEKDIEKEEPGTHNGGGRTKAYSFFAEAPNLHLIFRKRILLPGSSIGYHLQKDDEIYYIIKGTGEMNMNGRIFRVNAGDAILTRPGNSHGLKPLGNDSLTVLINYYE